MTTENPGSRAVSDYEIEDVFMVETKCHVDREFNQTQLMGEIRTLHRLVPDPAVLMQTRTLVVGDEKVFVVRYFLKGELRLLKPIVPTEKTEFSDSDFLAEFEVTFAADYRCSKAAQEDREAVSAFMRNAIFHVWPYWRELVSELAARMRLQAVTIPMLKPPATLQQTPPQTSVVTSD